MNVNSYFPHDSNSRNSDKLLPVRMRFGAEGYGIYFMILERLRDESNYMSVKDYNMLAFDLRVDAGKVKSIVEDFGLFAFTDDGECFYSEGFNKRMEIKDAKSKKRSEAGKKGALKRWQTDSNAIAKLNESDSNVIATPRDLDSKESKGKETKVKESKTSNKDKPVRHQYGEYKNVLLTDADYQKLNKEIPNLIILIEDMSEWLKAHGKSYKDYAAALRKWRKRDMDQQKKSTPFYGNQQKRRVEPREPTFIRNQSEFKEEPRLTPERQAELDKRLKRFVSNSDIPKE